MFTFAMMVAFPAFAWFGWNRAEGEGIAAATIAAVLCWVSAGISLVLLGVFARKGQLVVGVLGGMLLRMAPPLIACFVFVGKSPLLGDGGSLAKAGAGGMILIYYLIALTVETLLSLRLTGLSKAAGARVSGSSGSGEGGADGSGSKPSAAAT